MRVKDPNKVGNWKFFLLDYKGDEVEIGSFSRREQLINELVYLIEVFDRETKGEYSKELRKLAVMERKGFKDYLGMLVEHQMCVRNKMDCWSGGVGDDVHSLFGKLDDAVEKAPKIIKKAYQRFSSTITPSHTRRMGGCSACGGSRVMDPSSNNLGRAGVVNRILGRGKSK